MKPLSVLPILLLGAATGACSKSSGEASASAKPVSGEAAPPATPPAAPSPPVAATDEDLCEEACSNLGTCIETVDPEEHFRDGNGCVQGCLTWPAAERVAWAAKLAHAVRTNTCDRYLAEQEGAREGAAVLAAGERPLGCFAWSARHAAAACAGGDHGGWGGEVRLAFVGSALPAIQLPVPETLGEGVSIPRAVADRASAVLAAEGFDPLGAALSVAAGRSKEVGGVTIRFTSKVTDRGGDGAAPTRDERVVATCGGRTLELYRKQEEGRQASVSVRPAGNHVLVEIAVDIGLEGEYGNELHAAVIEPGSCTVSRSGS